nr:MAG TPA: hypothetical protein [Caudoviricetes sp.]
MLPKSLNKNSYIYSYMNIVCYSTTSSKKSISK